ncbi:MAG: hypothetical protein ACTHM7_16720 [Ginsengibacter sp.]
MKKRNQMVEILFVTLAGLITIGLSVNSILKSKRQENELREKQNQLDSAQKAIIEKQNSLINLQELHAQQLKDKSDEVIQLQKKLQEKSDIQLEEIYKIKNPIPSDLDITLMSSLVLTKDEFEKLDSIAKLKYPVRGNLLPFDFNTTNDAFEKINAFKNVAFRLVIVFEKDGKILRVELKRTPALFVGYNASGYFNAFLATTDEKSDRVRFNGLNLETNDITTNYSGPSMSDFAGSNVKISYFFSYPHIMQNGKLRSTVYVEEKPEYITLDLESVVLRYKNYSIRLEGLKKIDSHTFETIWNK